MFFLVNGGQAYAKLSYIHVHTYNIVRYFYTKQNKRYVNNIIIISTGLTVLIVEL